MIYLGVPVKNKHDQGQDQDEVDDDLSHLPEFVVPYQPVLIHLVPLVLFKLNLLTRGLDRYF